MMETLKKEVGRSKRLQLGQPLASGARRRRTQHAAGGCGSQPRDRCASNAQAFLFFPTFLNQHRWISTTQFGMHSGRLRSQIQSGDNSQRMNVALYLVAVASSPVGRFGYIDDRSPEPIANRQQQPLAKPRQIIEVHHRRGVPTLERLHRIDRSHPSFVVSDRLAGRQEILELRSS